MQSVSISAAIPRSSRVELLRTVSFTILVLFVLAWASAAASDRGDGVVAGPGDTPTADRQAAAVNDSPENGGADTETVTMSIPLEEGAVIDVEAPPMGLTIEKWDGDDVLLIVEKTKRSRPGDKTTPVDPVNIQVTRRGKDVRIETTGGAGWENHGMDLSFRILLPDEREIEAAPADTEDVAARLTGVLWRAFHREALKWLAR